MWTELGALEQYYPLTGTTFWIDNHLWGDLTLPYHLENIWLHAGSSLLLALLLSRLQVPGAFLAAVLFATHPIMVESVAWITERKNVLSLFLFLAALNTSSGFTSWSSYPQKNLRIAFALTFILFLTSLLAKASAIVFPVAFLLISWWKKERLTFKHDFLPMIPFFITGALIVSQVNTLEAKMVAAAQGVPSLNWPGHILVAGRIFCFYIAKICLPLNLCAVYPRWKVSTGNGFEWLYPTAALSLLALLGFLSKRLGRGPLTALLFFSAALTPMLGFIQVAGMHFSFVADRWTYLPSLGIIIPLAAGLQHLGKRPHWRLPVRTLIALIVVSLSCLTWQRSGIFQSGKTLRTATLTQNPISWKAANNLGTILHKEGNTRQAMALFRTALELKPDFTDAHNNLANSLKYEGDLTGALSSYDQALSLEPTIARTHFNRSTVLARMGRTSDAIDGYLKAIALDPTLIAAHMELGGHFLQTGRPDLTLKHYETALQLEPGNPAIKNNLAWFLATTSYDQIRNGPRAVELAESLASSSPEYLPQFDLTLATAYAETGRFDDAAAIINKAANRADAEGNNALASSLRPYKDKFEKRLPIRTNP
jgi:tetratricopeptide (TPR) repeat protein